MTDFYGSDDRVYDVTGMWAMNGWREEFPPEAEQMYQPVQCGFCSRIYDLGTVTVTSRYVDCSVWRTPCCGHTADDRGESGWKSRQDYHRLSRPGGEPLP